MEDWEWAIDVSSDCVELYMILLVEHMSQFYEH